MAKQLTTNIIVLEVTTEKDVPELAEMIAQRGYTIQGVTATRVVSAGPSAHQRSEPATL